jgi:hypothetical protein
MQKIESMEKIDCGFNFDKDIKNKKDFVRLIWI